MRAVLKTWGGCLRGGACKLTHLHVDKTMVCSKIDSHAWLCAVYQFTSWAWTNAQLLPISSPPPTFMAGGTAGLTIFYLFVYPLFSVLTRRCGKYSSTDKCNLRKNPWGQFLWSKATPKSLHDIIFLKKIFWIIIMLLNIYINLFYKTIKIDYVVRIIMINSNKNLWALLNNCSFQKNFWETAQNLRIFTLHSQTCNDRFLFTGVASTEPCPGLTSC